MIGLLVNYELERSINDSIEVLSRNLPEGTDEINENTLLLLFLCDAPAHIGPWPPLMRFLNRI
jgi:hypothetical protein